MLGTPVRTDAEAAANAAFDALLWALSRPGLGRDLPEPGEAGIIAALLDRECRAYSADPRLVAGMARASRAGRAACHVSGAPATPAAPAHTPTPRAPTEAPEQPVFQTTRRQRPAPQEARPQNTLAYA